MSTIVFEGVSKKNHPYIIRLMANSDVPGLHEYINTLSQERTYITFQGEQVSLEEEAGFVNSQIQEMEEGGLISLVVEAEGQIIGIASITLQPRVHRHVGLLGISIHQNYREEGIGKKLLETIIAESVKHLSELRLIKLEVFANNLTARVLYQSAGFIEYGRLPQGIFYRDEYIDTVLMYKKI